MYQSAHNGYKYNRTHFNESNFHFELTSAHLNHAIDWPTHPIKTPASGEPTMSHSLKCIDRGSTAPGISSSLTRCHVGQAPNKPQAVRDNLCVYEVCREF